MILSSMKDQLVNIEIQYQLIVATIREKLEKEPNMTFISYLRTELELEDSVNEMFYYLAFSGYYREASVN